MSRLKFSSVLSIVVAIITGLLPYKASADEHQTTSFYDPFKAEVRTTYDPAIISVGQAVVYLLGPTGYRITVDFPAPPESATIMHNALSPIARTNRVMSIEEALLEVIGEHNKLIIDHEHRLVSVGKYIK